ncbi:MAG: DNA-processing protein DprA [Candidatus Latescibacteria bacterium]|nr:DNA-processing protein DprA [Candidatus Latescibacterota bacterium]
MEDLSSWLTLLAIPGIGPSRFQALVKKFGSPKGVLDASVKQLMQLPRMDEKTALAIKNYRDQSYIEKQLADIQKHQVQMVGFQDPEYPELLRQIHDPPSFLFVKGDLECLKSESVAIVGTRGPTIYGKITAEKIAREVAARGITVVSGMARGIDSVAHRAALARGGKTVAVLGCGLDVVYPPENLKLQTKIAQTGALISEFPMGTSPDAPNFPRRNRIISGLSLGVVVVEAGERSGAILTAKYALDQNREVFAVPGNVNAAKSRGTNALIKRGAKLVQTIEDIVEELWPMAPTLFKPPPIAPSALPELSAEERTVLESLSSKPKHIDKISADTGMTTGKALSILLSLELSELVKQLAGKMFVRM